MKKEKSITRKTVWVVIGILVLVSMADILVHQFVDNEGPIHRLEEFKLTEHPIDREAVVTRNNVHVYSFDSLASLSVGNGNFAYTFDATGLQSFPEHYAKGVSLGTQSQWGWHSFPNTEGYTPEETFKSYNFRGKEELYAVQFKGFGRQRDASEYYRVNPHRLHLGYIGLEMTDASGNILGMGNISEADQQLDLYNGCATSSFTVNTASIEGAIEGAAVSKDVATEGFDVNTETACHPGYDAVASKVVSSGLKCGQLKIRWMFPYAKGGHVDDATDWTHPEKHVTEIVSSDSNSVILKRVLDSDVYYVQVSWTGNATFEKASDRPHTFILTSSDDSITFVTAFVPEQSKLRACDFETVKSAASEHWNAFWQQGGAVDFSACTDPRAPELERRVILSEYLMAIQCAGIYPPQETGLTFNSWYGKYHLEMHWWHAAHFPLWGKEKLLEPSLEWYKSAAPYARTIAQRQGFEGLRWMKMTDPSAIEAPSSVGSFLLWQQPHYIYLAELIRRNHPQDITILDRYKDLVFESADFIASFLDYDASADRYILQGVIPAQETLKASETINPPFELSYMHYALKTAQEWRERCGLEKNVQWETILDKLSPLAYNDDKLYLAAETAIDTYRNIVFTSDHPAVLGALGVLPDNRLIRDDIMSNTFDWIWDKWNWGKTWGWDYPMTAMCAARLNRPDKAVDALLMDRRTNTYLPNGHNYQDDRLRIYLPGNGGLLTAVAMMCAGWDGKTAGKSRRHGKVETHVGGPGFPDDGTWYVRWEGLQPMP